MLSCRCVQADQVDCVVAQKLCSENYTLINSFFIGKMKYKLPED